MLNIIGLSFNFLTFFFYFSFTLLFTTFIKFQTKSNQNTKTCPLPPGPKPWPIIGCLPELLNNKPIFRWINKLMDEMNAEIICIRMGDIHVISVTSPEIAREFLRKQDHIFSSRPICLSAEVLSGGYLTTAVTPFGDQWKKMRKILISQVVSPARHHWLQAKRDEESDDLVRYMYKKCKTNDGLVNIRTIARHFCGNMMRKIILGKRYFGKGGEDGGPGLEEEEHIRGIFTVLKYLYAFCISDYFPSLRCLDLDNHEKYIKGACANVRKFQDPIVDERVRQWRNGASKEPDDILDVLIRLTDVNGEPLLTSDEIKAQVLEMMTAAVDNPSHMVEWVLAELLNQPETLRAAIKELDRVVGPSRLVQESDIPHLNYIKSCIKEAFRLHPINSFNLPHVSNSDTIVTGYFIPKGSHVFLSRLGLGRNARVWPEPLKFRPNRHLEEGGGDVVLSCSEMRMILFSSGRRGCVAPVLGSTMTVMLLARLLHGFSYSLPPGVHKIELEECVDSLELIEPLVVVANPRLDESLFLAL